MESTSKIKSFILGVFIGIAVIIPGFSGAQLAIIFKLYDKIIQALDKLFTKKSIVFLVPIVIGAILGFLLGLFTVQFLLELSVFCVVAAFAGLMLGGLPSTIDEVKGKPFKSIYLLNLIIGLIIPFGISVTAIMSNFNLSSLIETLPWYMYLIAIGIGFLIALTQLIPGLSATALLMSFGLYDALLSSISVTTWKENPMILVLYVAFVLGALIGVLSISKIINKQLEKHKTGFYYLIIGLCISSILSMFYNPEVIDVYNNIDTRFYIELIIGIVLFILFAIFVYFSYRYINKKEEGLKLNS